MAQATLADRRADARPDSWDLGTIAGLAVALGSASVVMTSLFYILSPPPIVTPVLQAKPGAVSATIEGAATMRIAGSFGVLGNLVLAVGCLLMAIERALQGRAVAVAGWAMILMSLVVFEIVDGLFGFVLSRAAADPGGMPVFFAFRNLYAVFFLVGTAAFGLGAILALAQDRNAVRAWRLPAIAGMANGAMGLFAALATVVGLPFERLVGLSVGLGAIIFVGIGIHAATKSTRVR